MSNTPEYIIEDLNSMIKRADPFADTAKSMPKKGDIVLVKFRQPSKYAGVYYAICSDKNEFDVHMPWSDTAEHYREEWYKFSRVTIASWWLIPGTEEQAGV